MYCTLKHLRRSVLNDLSFGVQLTFHKQLIFFIKRNKMLSICIQYIRMQRPEALEGRELSCQENFCYKHTFKEMQHISSTCILFSRKEKNGEQLIYFDMDTRHESTQVNINKLSLFPLAKVEIRVKVPSLQANPIIHYALKTISVPNEIDFKYKSKTCYCGYYKLDFICFWQQQEGK